MPLFFGLGRPLAATIDIIALTGVVGYLAKTWAQVDETAAWLMAPYLGWLSFATYLSVRPSRHALTKTNSNRDAECRRVPVTSTTGTSGMLEKLPSPSNTNTFAACRALRANLESPHVAHKTSCATWKPLAGFPLAKIYRQKQIKCVQLDICTPQNAGKISCCNNLSQADSKTSRVSTNY